jgi:hypothetical protein
MLGNMTREGLVVEFIKMIRNLRRYISENKIEDSELGLQMLEMEVREQWPAASVKVPVDRNLENIITIHKTRGPGSESEKVVTLCKL